MPESSREQAYKLTIAYDGTHYSGWQRQRDPVVTVQQVVEKGISEILNRPTGISGASRTDAGVHAWGQVAVFRGNMAIPLDRFRMAVNSRLPPDVLIRQVEPVSEQFDVTRARRKRYRYVIWQSRDRPIFNRQYMYHYWQEVSIEAMRAGCRYFIGQHDFIAFRGGQDDRQTTVRTIFNCDVHRRGPLIIMSVEGDGFLYHMVRNMVGTILEIGRRRLPPEQVMLAIKSGRRSDAGPCAPASGLCLMWVQYPPDVACQMADSAVGDK
jgi:tRNA pseudouridine38-40 synthase